MRLVVVEEKTRETLAMNETRAEQALFRVTADDRDGKAILNPVGQPLIRVTADDRERDSRVIEALMLLPGVRVKVGRLKLGDYVVNDEMVFERKSLADLAASVQDGRLFRQAKRLVSGPMRCAIILEGTSQDLAKSGMRREALQGALVSLTLNFGLPVLRALDPPETARLMIYAARQLRSARTGAWLRGGTRPKGKRRQQFRILQGMPRVGPERARKLLEKFGTVEAVILATEDELQEVHGIGQGTAKAIRWAVSESPSAYALRQGESR